MQKNRTGCLVVLLAATVIVAVMAFIGAWVVLNWSAGNGELSVDLPLPARRASVTPTATPVPPQPTATVKQLNSSATQPAAPTAQPQSGTPTPPQAIILTDPSLSDLASELSHLYSGQSIHITMSEDALQQELYKALGGDLSVGYQFQSVNMVPGRLIISGKAQMDALVVALEVTARPYVSDCWFDVQVEQVKLGRFPAPAFVSDQVQASITQWTEAYRNTDLICVSEITITNDQMILAGIVL